MTRQRTEDLYIQAPVYIDVYDVVPLLDSMAFEQNLLIKGPSGIAKSLMILRWFQLNKIPVVIEQCTEETKDYKLKGTQTAVGGDFVFVLGSMPTAIDVPMRNAATQPI